MFSINLGRQLLFKSSIPTMQALRTISHQRAQRLRIMDFYFRRHMAFSPSRVMLFEDKSTDHEKVSKANPGQKDTEMKGSLDSNSATLKGGSHKHDSMKWYREGPNPEGGELDPKSGSAEVKKHNKSVAERHNHD